MIWTEGWTGEVGGRHVTVLTNAEGDIRVSVRPQSVGSDALGFPVDIEPAEDESLVEALIAEGDFTQDEADEILRHVGEAGPT